jgi:3-hydroxybutyryl-CoA dehydrogenase
MDSLSRWMTAYGHPGIAGSGTIACELAACASQAGSVRLLARSDAAAWRAEEEAQKAARKLEGGAPERIKVTTKIDDLADRDVVVEAIVEDIGAKASVIGELAQACPDADLASTTSSLSLDEIGEMSGAAGRFFGLHVFNPVTRMELIELCIPPAAHAGIRERAIPWCEAMGKTPVEVADQPGFVVNRLLFPFLFEAVRLMETTGMSAADVDTCMKLGAGHPMGPLKLLDFVGLDVAAAIGESLHADSHRESDDVPELIRSLVRGGKLGRKSGEGFYRYD